MIRNTSLLGKGPAPSNMPSIQEALTMLDVFRTIKTGAGALAVVGALAMASPAQAGWGGGGFHRAGAGFGGGYHGGWHGGFGWRGGYSGWHGGYGYTGWHGGFGYGYGGYAYRSWGPRFGFAGYGYLPAYAIGYATPVYAPPANYAPSAYEVPLAHPAMHHVYHHVAYHHSCNCRCG
jgi:hypothetical protein